MELTCSRFGFTGVGIRTGFAQNPEPRRIGVHVEGEDCVELGQTMGVGVGRFLMLK